MKDQGPVPEEGRKYRDSECLGLGGMGDEKLMLLRGPAGITAGKWSAAHFKAGLALMRFQVVGARAGQGETS